MTPTQNYYRKVFNLDYKKVGSVAMNSFAKSGSIFKQRNYHDNSAAQTEEVRKELSQAVNDSNEVLASAQTIVPMFPDIIKLDRAKLTVLKRNFFFSGDIISIRLEDILNVEATVGPLFGSIKIVSRIYTGDPLTVGMFWRKDALRMKSIVQGYMLALKRNIDCSELPKDELRKLLDEIGEDSLMDE